MSDDHFPLYHPPSEAENLIIQVMSAQRSGKTSGCSQGEGDRMPMNPLPGEIITRYISCAIPLDSGRKFF